MYLILKLRLKNNLYYVFYFKIWVTKFICYINNKTIRKINLSSLIVFDAIPVMLWFSNKEVFEF